MVSKYHRSLELSRISPALDSRARLTFWTFPRNITFSSLPISGSDGNGVTCYSSGSMMSHSSHAIEHSDKGCNESGEHRSCPLWCKWMFSRLSRRLPFLQMPLYTDIMRAWCLRLHTISTCTCTLFSSGGLFSCFLLIVPQLPEGATSLFAHFFIMTRRQVLQGYEQYMRNNTLTRPSGYATDYLFCASR